jgi:hypothetical protein
MGNAAAVLGAGAGLRPVEVHGKDVGGVAAYVPQLCGCSSSAAYPKCSPIYIGTGNFAGICRSRMVPCSRFVLFLTVMELIGCSRAAGCLYFGMAQDPFKKAQKQAEASDGLSAYRAQEAARHANLLRLRSERQAREAANPPQDEPVARPKARKRIVRK